MNKILFPTIQDRLYSEQTENNYHSNIKNNFYKDTSKSISSLNKTSNQTYLKISFYPTGIKTQKNGASLCLNLIHNQNKQKIEGRNNYTQHIILHTAKNKKRINEERNKIQKTTLKSLEEDLSPIERETKEQIDLYKNELDKTRNESNEIKKSRGNIISYDRNNIIKVIVSSEKLMKNFPMEYINEMISDICYNLLNNEYTYDKIKLKNENSFLFNQESQNFYELRKYYFNFIIQISLNTTLCESTIFLAFAIFDRFLCSAQVNLDDLLLVLITSFVLAIKYNESSDANFDELCDICGKKFNKEDIKKCELNIMDKLNYNLSIPTIFDLFQFIKIIKYLNEKEYYFGLFVLEMFVINGRNLKYNAIIIIEAVYKLIIQTYGKQTKNFILYDYLMNSGIDIIKYEENINVCLSDIKNDCIDIKNNNDFIYLVNKFSDDKFQNISIDYQLI